MIRLASIAAASVLVLVASLDAVASPPPPPTVAWNAQCTTVTITVFCAGQSDPISASDPNSATSPFVPDNPMCVSSQGQLVNTFTLANNTDVSVGDVVTVDDSSTTLGDLTYMVTIPTCHATPAMGRWGLALMASALMAVGATLTAAHKPHARRRDK
jgi:hypothetical protein